ncbi:unnamed protein product [marine sediment metagenome]|uniref:Permease n=1 Tax=marine sediment metagenome TaxID=412755 RepID=X0W9A4_9ZZZZ
MNTQKLKKAVVGLINNMKMSLPVLVGVLLLVGLVNTSIPKVYFTKIFTGNNLLDPFIGTAFGSVAAGNPLTSYIIGGELLKNGINLAAVVAFILSWVTVGTVQLPAESLMLGKRFALVRNGISFVMAILVALLTVTTLEVI